MAPAMRGYALLLLALTLPNPSISKDSKEAEATWSESFKDVELRYSLSEYLEKHNHRWKFRTRNSNLPVHIIAKHLDISRCGSEHKPRPCCLTRDDSEGLLLKECSMTDPSELWLLDSSDRISSFPKSNNSVCLDAGSPKLLTTCDTDAKNAESGRAEEKNLQIWKRRHDFIQLVNSTDENDPKKPAFCLAMATGSPFCNGSICRRDVPSLVEGTRLTLEQCSAGDRSQFFEVVNLEENDDEISHNLVPEDWTTGR